MYEVEAATAEVKARIDHRYLNDVPGLEVPSLENLTRWLWEELSERVPGVDRVLVQRGFPGSVEGCTYGRVPHGAASFLATERTA